MGSHDPTRLGGSPVLYLAGDAIANASGGDQSGPQILRRYFILPIFVGWPGTGAVAPFGSDKCVLFDDKPLICSRAY